MNPHTNFLRTLFAGTEGHFAVLLGPATGGTFPASVQWYPVTDLDDPDFELALEPDPDFNVFVVPHTYTAATNERANASATTSVLWLESDDHHFNHEHITEARPSFVVETSPDRHHLYWLLDHPIPIELAEALNAALAAKYIKGDRSGFDRYQPLRVPGFANHKRGDLFSVSLLVNDPDHRVDPDVVFADLVGVENEATMTGARTFDSPNADPPDPTPADVIIARREATNDPFSKTFKTYVHRQQKDRSSAMYYLYAECHRLRVPEADAYSLLLSSPNNKFSDNLYNGERELWADVRAAYRMMRNNEPGHVRLQIQSARLSNTNNVLRNSEIAEIVRKHMASSGGLYYIERLRQAVYQQQQYGRRRLFRISARDSDFEAFLDRIYDINAANPEYQYVVNNVRNHVAEHGVRVDIHSTSFYDTETSTLYISNNQGGMFRLSPDEPTWEELEIGVDNIMFNEDPYGEPIKPVAPPANTPSLLDTYVLKWPNYTETPHLSRHEAMRLIRAWVYSMFFLRTAKGLCVVTGPAGSGKTTVFKALEWALRGDQANILNMPPTPKELSEIMRERHHVFFDGVEEASGYIQNALSVAGTGSQSTTRKLYTDNELITYNVDPAIGISTMNADFIRRDIIDRSIVLNVERFDSEFLDTETIRDDVRRYRSQIWHEILTDLHAIIKLMAHRTATTSQLRMANVARIIELTCEVRGYNAHRLINYVARDQAHRTLEDDPIWEALSRWLARTDSDGSPRNLARPVAINELHSILTTIGHENHIAYRQNVKSAKSLTWQLKRLAPWLPVHVHQNREGRVSTFTFTPRDDAPTSLEPTT